MRLHMEALFTQDARGRMVCVNEPDGDVAPRFYIGRTVHGSVWRFRHDLDDGLVQTLETLCSKEVPGEEYVLPPHGSGEFEDALARTAPVQKKWAGPAYRFPRSLPVTSETLCVREPDSAVLHADLVEWIDDIPERQPFVVYLHAGRAVSVCCSVRKTRAAHEAGVETAQAFRGRGYAAQVVAAWARAVRELGAVPLYSTSWSNRSSQAVATRLGLVRYGTDLHMT